MSAVKMMSARAISPYQERAIKWADAKISDIAFGDLPSVSPSTKTAVSLLSVYRIFLALASLLAVFFVVSLVLAFTTQYFLDWGSALVGFLGTAGLSAVAWFSKREIE